MKTPLVAIGGFSKRVQKELDKNHPGHGKLDIVIRETRRLENMMKDMLDFARPLELDRRQEDINKIISESLSVIEAEAERRQIILDVNLEEDLPRITVDVMKMERVLINLLMNAVQASPDGEAVSIQTYKDGGQVIIDIADSGCGIQPDQQGSIFDPFFTTKREGTGLGLPIAKKIVEAHEGCIEAIENPEQGVTFRFVLPLR
jgi:signal transduction histidine kinase